MTSPVSGPTQGPPLELPLMSGVDDGSSDYDFDLSFLGLPTGPRERGFANDRGLPPPDPALLVKLFNYGSVDDIIVSLGTLRAQSLENAGKRGEISIKDMQERAGAAAEERERKISEQREKQEESKKQGLIGKIFGWIAAALTMIVGVILAATGVASTLGATMIAMAATTVAVMILTDKELGESIGLEGSLLDSAAAGLGKLLEAFGLDADLAKTIASMLLVTTIALIGAAIGTAIGGPALGAAMFLTLASMFFTPENMQGFGASEEVSNWLSLGLSVAMQVGAMVAGLTAIHQAASKVAQEVAETVRKIVVIVRTVVQLTAAAVNATKGGLAIYQGTLNAAIAGLQAEGLELRAVREFLNSKISEELDDLKEFTVKLSRVFEQMAESIEMGYQANQRVVTA